MYMHLFKLCKSLKYLQRYISLSRRVGPAKRQNNTAIHGATCQKDKGVHVAVASQQYLDCLEMLVEVVSVVLRAPIDSTSEDSGHLSLRLLWGWSDIKKERQLIIGIILLSYISCPQS